MPNISRPRYQELASQLRAQVQRGELKPGERLPSFVQMRRQGVSQHTMEKTYSLLEADGLIERSNGSGVYVAQRAAKKRWTRTGIIGVAGLNHGGERHAYWNDLLAGAQQAARKANCSLLLLEDGDVDWERMDGVLSMGYGGVAVALRRPEPMPAASLLAVLANAPGVGVDDCAGVEQLVEHLVNLGHRKIAYLAPPLNVSRTAAYRKALDAAGIQTDDLWLRDLHPSGQFDNALGFAGHAHETMSRWLREDWKELGCTALMAYNDEAAIGVLKALRAAKIEVPSQVSVTGFDGTELAAHADPPLTTIKVPLHEIGARGVKLLLQQAQEGIMGEHFTVPGQLHIGASTAPPLA